MDADTWGDGGAYEQYVGRWSRLVAAEFLSWLAVPPGRRWLDVGCGTGAFTRTILSRCAPSAVLGVDLSVSYIAYARQFTGDERAQFLVGDAQALPIASGSFDVIVSGLALNFVPDPARAAAEMARARRPGGTVALYVWDYAHGMQFMRSFWDAAVALDPAARQQDEGQRFPLCQPEPLQQLFAAANLAAIETRAIDVPTVFQDFDDFWTPFLGAQGPAPTYLSSLDEPHRIALRERLRAHLPIAADGTIALTARAWAVRGR